MSEVHTVEPVVSVTPSLLQRLCGRLTNHRFTRPVTGWRPGRAMIGEIYQRTIKCRLCNRRWIEWQTWEPTHD